MAFTKTKFLGLFWHLILLTVVNTTKLNVPHVLLPIFDKINTNFTLEAINGGCYTWRTMRVDLVRLIPVDADPTLSCSQSAVVSAITKEKSRNVAIVLAQEVHTKVVLRVDVFVDVINTLSIATTTKEIIMDEVPEIFKVVAFDSQGNSFTSLEGIEFDWTIVCMGPNKNLAVLRFMTFQESPYETPPEIESFEEQNKRGHIVLLEGVKSGSTKVQVQLPYEEYNHINAYEVQLSVVANLIIIPADVHIIKGDVVLFKVFSMNNGNMEEIKLPNLQYYLEVELKDIASADPDKGEVVALRVGRTKIVLHDRNADETDPCVKLPFAILTVEEPAYLTINVLPHNNLAIFLSEQHDIVIEAFSRKDNKLHLGPGVEIYAQIGEIFHVQERSENGSWLTGWAVQEGVASVQATLEGVVHSRLGRFKIGRITAKSDIYVYPCIVLIPAEVILPWDLISKPKYQVDIIASGGDGKFLWISSNNSIGVVSQTGSVRTHSHGTFEVSAAMQKNHHNRQSVRFTILPPSRLEIVEFLTEAKVGTVIFLHVALFTERPGELEEQPSYIPFTHCQELPLRVITSNTKVIHDNTVTTSPVGISCGNIAVVSNDVGSSKVTVRYVNEGLALEDSVTVSWYKPLKHIHPIENVVLPVGSSISLVYEGGPRPTIGHLSGFKRAIISSDNKTVKAEDATELYNVSSEDEITVIRVLCRRLGSSTISLSVSNAPLNPNCKTVDAKVTAKVICGKPRSLFLQPAIKVADASSCPMDLSADRVVVQSHQDVELNVIVKDESGFRFLNISSLKFDWSTSPENLAALKSVDGSVPRPSVRGNLDLSTDSYQIVTPNTQVGQINVKARLVGYHKNILHFNEITPEWPEFVDQEDKGTELLQIVAEISLLLVEDTIVTPDEITIYNHPENKQTLTVNQGSGYYELAFSNDNIADVKYYEGTREIIIVPIAPGDLRINLIDLCLVSRPAVISVTVVSVVNIKVEMSDKVELSKYIPCTVKLYDDSDHLLSSSNIQMVALRHQFENEIANIKRLPPDGSSHSVDGKINFVITGQELGNTKLMFSVITAQSVVTSSPLDLQVFPPLFLYPRNATLVLGSSIQYSHKGGPQPDSNIEYAISMKDIADINAGGVLQGVKLGSTKVHVRVLGVNPTTGLKFIYAQDFVDATVIPVTGIRISAPLTRFKMGMRVPIWATGLPEQLTPLILGTVSPSFTYSWAVGDSDIVEIQGIFQKIGIQYDPEDQMSVQLIGRNPGRTKLHLNVTVPGISANYPKKQFVTLMDSIDIEVFEELILTSPNDASGLPVLLAPHSSLQLQTNMDSVHKISYKLLGENSSGGTDLQPTSEIPKQIVTVSNTGLLISYGNIGHAIVLITSSDDYDFKQSISVVIKVKAIHYMILDIAANWILPADSSNVIPLGTEFKLRATYHDNTGNTFSAGTGALRVRTSRFDLARVTPGSDNSTLIVATKKPGQVILKVWRDGPKKIADYVKLNIGQAVVPLVDCFVSGDIVCFWTPVSSKTSGKWSSSDPNLLSVDSLDSHTGIGKASGTKRSYVTVSNSLHPFTTFQLQILPVTHVELLTRTNAEALTNAIGAKTFTVPVVFKNEVDMTKRNNFLNGQQCKDKVVGFIKSYPFVCLIKFSNVSVEISPESIFNVESTFIAEEGTYSCNLASTGLSSPIISTLDTNVILTVESDNYVLSEPLEIPFFPAIYLNTELTLDPETYIAELVIVGSNDVLNEVTVISSDKNLLHVYEGERTFQHLRHEIHLLDYHWKLDELKNPLYLTIQSKLTNENVKVIVKGQAGDKFHRQECSSKQGIGTFFYNNHQTIIILVSLMVIFFVTIYAYSNCIQPVINVNMTPTRSLQSSGAAAVEYMKNLRRSPQTNYTSPLNVSGNSPVYGDPSNFYSTSPELRRNRRFM